MPQERTVGAADKGLFALMNHTAVELARLTGPPPGPPENTTLVGFRPPVLVYNSTDLGTETLDVVVNLTERFKNATANHLSSGDGGGGMGDWLAGLLRGGPKPGLSTSTDSGMPGASALSAPAQGGAGADPPASAPGIKTPQGDPLAASGPGNKSAAGSAASTGEPEHKSLLGDAQKLLGNDTLKALSAAVFPFILVRLLSLPYTAP